MLARQSLKTDPCKDLPEDYSVSIVFLGSLRAAKEANRKHVSSHFTCSNHALKPCACVEAIDVPWGYPASFNASGLGSVTAVDTNTSRYRDVAAVVGDTITIHWNHTAGGNFSLWQVPTGMTVNNMDKQLLNSFVH